MKIDRRCFLSLGVGATAGITLSPLPWKLTDDASIWTQNWAWTPVPVDGEISYEATACKLCPGGCGLTIRKIGNRAVKVEGADGHPISDGGVCLLGLSALQLLYGPTRVSAPMKRVGNRGTGQWKKITWDQAITEVSEQLKNLRDKGDAHTVAGLVDTDQGTTAKLVERFLTALGTPNFMRMPSYEDAYEVVFKLMHGQAGLPGFDIENATFILSFGSGLLDGWGGGSADDECQ